MGLLHNLLFIMFIYYLNGTLLEKIRPVVTLDIVYQIFFAFFIYSLKVRIILMKVCISIHIALSIFLSVKKDVFKLFIQIFF